MSEVPWEGIMKNNILKTIDTLINKGIKPAYKVENAGGYDNGFFNEDAVIVDGYSLTISYGSGWAYNWSELSLVGPKGSLFIKEGFLENGDSKEYFMPDRLGRKILRRFGYQVFDNAKQLIGRSQLWDYPIKEEKTRWE